MYCFSTKHNWKKRIFYWFLVGEGEKIALWVLVQSAPPVGNDTYNSSPLDLPDVTTTSASLAFVPLAT